LPASPQATTPATPSPEDIQREVFDVTRQVLAEAGSSPKAALMLLASQIEAELRGLVEETGGQLRPRSTFQDSVAYLRTLEVPESLVKSMLQFRGVRNHIIHGHEADEDNVIRAIDSGLRILNAIKALRRKVLPIDTA
jgi:hypothetical protein